MGMLSKALKRLNGEGMEAALEEFRREEREILTMKKPSERTRRIWRKDLEREQQEIDERLRRDEMARNSPPLRSRKKNEEVVDIKQMREQHLIEIDEALIPSLERMADERGISVEKLINIRLQAMVFSFDNGRALSLNDPMPFGQYKGVIIEDLIRADGRYVRWLYGTSEIFELTESAREFLEEMS